MTNKTQNDVVRERNSGGVTARLVHPVRSSSDLTAQKLNTNADRKAEEFSEGTKRTAKGGVSMNEPRKTRGKRTVSSAFRTVRAPVQESPCVSVKGGSPVCNQTASSLAKKEARGGPETAKVTQTARIGKQAEAPIQKIAKGSRAKVQLDKKELSAGKQKSESPASSAKREETKPPCGTSKQSIITINPSPPIKPKKSIEVSGKKHLPKDQTSQAKQIQGKQLEYEASTSESSLDSDIYGDYEDHHIEWDGFAEPDKIEVCCCLCEKDLGVQPTEDGGKSEYYINNTKPVVAILPCGHAFHVDCLYFDEFELKPGGEPACIICESTMTD